MLFLWLRLFLLLLLRLGLSANRLPKVAIRSDDRHCLLRFGLQLALRREGPVRRGAGDVGDSGGSDGC